MTFWLTRRAEFINIAKDYDTISASFFFQCKYSAIFSEIAFWNSARNEGETSSMRPTGNSFSTRQYIDKLSLIIRNLF